jgi:hypothetical protein
MAPFNGAEQMAENRAEFDVMMDDRVYELIRLSSACDASNGADVDMEAFIYALVAFKDEIWNMTRK